MTRLLFTVALTLAPIALLADTLVLRNGTRVEGDLIAIRNGVIEFEERGTFGRSRRLQLDRADVARIEFDTPTTSYDRDLMGRRPSGMRERVVVVSANTAWNDAGIEVRAGQSIYFEATGEVRWGRDRRDGPAGEDNSPVNPNRPLPNRPAAALIAMVGTASNDIFFIGDDRGPIRVRSSGRLYLGINDDVLTDNSGNFRVTVYY